VIFSSASVLVDKHLENEPPLPKCYTVNINYSKYRNMLLKVEENNLKKAFSIHHIFKCGGFGGQRLKSVKPQRKLLFQNKGICFTKLMFK
jgi:hypothetical protein